MLIYLLGYRISLDLTPIKKTNDKKCSKCGKWVKLFMIHECLNGQFVEYTDIK